MNTVEKRPLSKTQDMSKVEAGGMKSTSITDGVDGVKIVLNP